MEINIQLSEQEQQWLQEIAGYYQVTLEEAIRLLLKEQHEQLAMELAFEKYPDGKLVEQDVDAEYDRSARKAALKRALIAKATHKHID